MKKYYLTEYIEVFCFVALIILLSSCNTSKHTSRTKTTDERINTLVAALTATNTNTTTIEETTNTLVAVPEKTAESTGTPVDSSTTTFEDAHTTATLTVIKGVKKLKTTTKPFSLPVDIKRKTTSVSAGGSTVNLAVSGKTVQGSDVKNASKVAKVSVFDWWWLLLLLIPIAVWRFRDRIWKWILGKV